jgi:hypothetical protein
MLNCIAPVLHSLTPSHAFLSVLTLELDSAVRSIWLRHTNNTARARFVSTPLSDYMTDTSLPLVFRFASSRQLCGVLVAKVCGIAVVSTLSMCATSIRASDHLLIIVNLQDWPRHKNECLAVAALSPAPIDPPPSMPFTAATFAAIIFPVDEPRPRIIHVECLAFIEPSSSLMNWTPRVREHMQAGPHDTVGSLTIETGISEGEWSKIVM